MDIGQTLTRHFHMNTTVQAVFTGNKQGADSKKINRNSQGKQSIIINNNKSGSEQMKFQGAFPELKETLKIKTDREQVLFFIHTTCTRYSTTLQSHLEPRMF